MGILLSILFFSFPIFTNKLAANCQWSDCRSVLISRDNRVSIFAFGGIEAIPTESEASLLVPKLGKIKTFDVKTGTLMADLGTNKCEITAIAASKDGNLLGWADSLSNVIVWDVPRKKQVLEIRHRKPEQLKIAISNDGDLLVVCSDHQMEIWNTRLRFVVCRKGLNASAYSSEVSADKKHVAVGLINGECHVLDLVSHAWVFTRQIQDAPITSLAFCNNSPKLLSGSGDSTICCTDVLTGKLLYKHRVGRVVRGLRINADDSLLMYHNSNNVFIHNLNTGLYKSKASVLEPYQVETANFSTQDLSIISILSGFNGKMVTRNLEPK